MSQATHASLRLGIVEAAPGTKAFGFFETGRTHGGFPVHIPLHIVSGSQPGPLLVVQAGVSGVEIEPAMILPLLVEALDPATVRGTLVVVPLMNTSGFEFEQQNTVWDNRDLHAVGRGKADGTVSEQMIARYDADLLSKADALIDIRTGAQWGYFRYAGVFKTGNTEASLGLAAALGLPQVLLGEPPADSMVYAAAEDGKAVVTAWIGGGPGLRDFREEDMARITNAVHNAMRHLGMLAGPLEHLEEDAATTVLDAHTFITVGGGERGPTFIDSSLRGKSVAAGDHLGYVIHPFTGKVVREIVAPRPGVVLHAGASWPMLPEDATLAILGDPIPTPASTISSEG